MKTGVQFVVTYCGMVANSGQRGSFRNFRIAAWRMRHRHHYTLATTNWTTLFARQTNSTCVNTLKVNVMYSYTNLPLLVNMHVTKGLAIKTGVQFGYLIGANTTHNELTDASNGDFTVRGRRRNDNGALAHWLFSGTHFRCINGALWK